MFRPICCDVITFLEIVVIFFVNVSQNEWKYLQKNLRFVKNIVLLQKFRLFINR